MKKTGIHLMLLIPILIVLVLLTACNPPVTFKEPQPADVKNTSQFPEKMQGTYISLADSSTLIISAKVMQRISEVEYKTHRNDLDSNLNVVGDTLINLETGEKTLVKIDGDSLISKINITDTIFQIDYDNVLRKFKGYYFINIRYGKEAWVVKKLEIKKAQLTISGISTVEDIEKLKEITEASDDTVAPYSFAPSKKQFDEFVKKDGFTDTEAFIRISKTTEITQ